MIVHLRISLNGIITK